jgi:hypothetical protein
MARRRERAQEYVRRRSTFVGEGAQEEGRCRAHGGGQRRTSRSWWRSCVGSATPRLLLPSVARE